MSSNQDKSDNECHGNKNESSSNSTELESLAKNLISGVMELHTEHLKQSLQKIENRVSVLEYLFGKISSDLTQAVNQITAKLDQFQQNIENQTQTLENRVVALEVQTDQFVPEIKDEFQTLKVSVENNVCDLKTLVVNPVQPVLDELKQSKDDTSQLVAMLDCSCKDKWEVEEAKCILPLALRFDMKRMVTKLCAVLKEALTVSTCVQFFQLASEFKLNDLWEASKQMILESFVEVSETEDFCNLSLKDLLIFVFCDDLRATEEDVFNAITCWILKDRTTRRPLASQLLPAVCFSSCSLKFLQDIQIHFLVNDHATVQEAIANAISEMQRNQFQKKVVWRNLVNAITHDVIFVFSGANNVTSIETFDQCKNSWVSHKGFDTSSGSLAVTMGEIILVLEYGDGNGFRSYDPELMLWTKLPPSPLTTNGLCAAQTGKDLYVMGGKNEQRCFYYNLERSNWTQTTNLAVCREHARSASLKGQIYCCGGLRSELSRNSLGFPMVQTISPLNSMEVFYPARNQWLPSSPMLSSRRSHCLVSCGQYLWAAGGYNTSALNDLDRFDPIQNLWVRMSPMPTKRSELSACFLNGQLYVIGGIDQRNLNCTEIYNCSENKWTIGAPLNQARSCFGACVVKQLAKAADYRDSNTLTTYGVYHYASQPTYETSDPFQASSLFGQAHTFTTTSAFGVSSHSTGFSFSQPSAMG